MSVWPQYGGIAWQTPLTILSHSGMIAVRLRVTLRTVITVVNPPTLPTRRRHLTIPALRSRARQAARRACNTRREPPAACAAREAIEAGARPPSSPGTDDRRS